MKLILSGYGTNLTDDLAVFSIDSNGNAVLEGKTTLENPSFICTGDGYLFAITEAKDEAYVYLLKYSADGFILLDQKKVDGGYLCHITYSSKNKALFGACYETGTIFSVRVEAGGFGEILYHEVQQGSEPGALTRAHMVLLNREETTLITVNIALDRIYTYEISEGSLHRIGILELEKGIGPRHVVYSPDERLLYIITEYSNEILVYTADDRKLLQRISTLHPDYQGISNCSTLCFSKDLRFLYAANRGAQTITLFRVKEDGTLEWMEEYDCGGKHPRHMIITEDGSYLAICNQNSDNVAIYELDSQEGGLNRLLLSIPFPSPSGIALF